MESVENLDDFTVSLSIGMTEFTDGQTLDEMLDLADRNMYEEKSQRAPSSDPGTGHWRPVRRYLNGAQVLNGRPI